jgi:hypothetical protein
MSMNTRKPLCPPHSRRLVPWNSARDVYYGNTPGGKDAPWALPETNRLLNPYVSKGETWSCPADRGFGADFKPSVFDVVGDSYRFNWALENDYLNEDPPTADDPVFNLGLKKESWVTDRRGSS